MAYYERGDLPKTRKAQLERLNKTIEAFTASRRLGDGNYAPVWDVDILQLGDIFDLLNLIKYEPDPDGDLPLTISITDLKHYERNYFRDIPRADDTFTEWQERLQHLNYNAEIANTMLHQELLDDRIEYFIKKFSYRAEALK